MRAKDFLCRDEAERRRLTDVGRSLRPGMPAIIGLFTIAGVSGVATYGWLPLLPPVAAIVVYALTWARNQPRDRDPELGYALSFVFAELMLALSIVIAPTRSADYLIVFALPLLPAAVLFPRRVVIAATALAVGLSLAVAFAVDWPEVSAIPAVGYCAPLVLFSLAVTALAVRDLEDDTRRAAFFDELTGALNRSALAPRLAELAHNVALTGETVAVVVGDIDHFKAVNDDHGHVTGDDVLREVARRLSDVVSAFEPVYRLGGEEFLVLLPGVDAGGAHAVASRMWKAVRDRPAGAVAITMSFGVAASVAGEPFDFDAVFSRADRALYAAKQAGRDRVFVANAAAAAPAAPTPHLRAIDRSPAPAESTPAERAAAGPPPDAGWTLGDEASPRRARPVTEELEREHILDLNRRLRVLFCFLGGQAFVCIAFAIPWYGWHPLIAPVLAAVPFYLLSRNAYRFRRPSRALTSAWALFQTSIAIGFVSAHGAPMFALSLLVLMVPGRCAVLRAKAAAAGTAYTAVLMTIVAFALDASQVLATPAILLFPLALLVEAGWVGALVGGSAVGFRGAGVVDELTGLLNRSALQARLLELGAASASRPPRVAILIADLDHFKQVNDRSGHAAGDAVLREAASRIRGCLRTFESAYRLGGEEFLVLLPDAEPAGARRVADRLRDAIGSEPCAGVAMTISVGVAVSPPGERFVYDDMFHRADAALYEAKRAGRDCVCVDDAPIEPAGMASGDAA